jgi:hypothetical protein
MRTKMDKIILIQIMCIVTTLSFSQTTYFDEKVGLKTKPLSNTVELNAGQADTLSRYFDAAVNKSNENQGIEIYRYSVVSMSGTRQKYFEVIAGKLRSLSVLEDEGRYVLVQTMYDEGFTERFQQLIDSTFWNYREPIKKTSGAVDHGAVYKIEGLKKSKRMTIEKTVPTVYDTLFRLPESFFRRY